ncbi:annexin B [Aphelenchoides avenae]|nr:annexin B [Aphelenchus avenae]
MRPAKCFEPKFDAEKLREAFHYVGGNDADVIEILCKRSNEQRQVICLAYKELVGDELVYDIKNAIDGEYRDLVVGLCQPLAEFYAWELHRAIKDHHGKVIVEILCTLNNREIDALKDAYLRIFGHSMEEDFRSHSRFRKNSIFQRLLMEKRKEEAGNDVEELKHRWTSLTKGSLDGADAPNRCQLLADILVKESYDQLRALFETYDDPAWNSMTRYIREKLPEEADAILSTTEAIGHPLRMFAENLRHFYDDETKWFGISSSQHDVIRSVVGRSEVDLGDILQCYERLYHARFLRDSNTTWIGRYETALKVLTSVDDA